MKKLLLIASLSGCFLFGKAQTQTTVTFENLSLEEESFWDGSDLSGGFHSGGIYFYNEFNGWFSDAFGYSNKTDVLTSGFTNDFSANTGGGYESDNYAVATANYGAASLSFKSPKIAEGAYITNNVYADSSMTYGDDYSKKFGGESGDDLDWFKLTATGFLEDRFTDTVEFYLADFRFKDNAKNYIIRQWTWMDLSKLGTIDSIAFTLSSSDNGLFGMNTPGYFCMDNFTYNPVLETSTISYNSSSVSVFPNPIMQGGNFRIESNETINELTISDLEGNVMPLEKQETYNSENLSPGMYLLKIQTETSVITKRIVITQ